MIYHTGGESQEKVDQINAFIKDLRDILEKHSVWMESVDCGLEVNHHVVTFTSQEDINDAGSDCNWFIEMVDMWPQESFLARCPNEFERIGGPEDGERITF
jgi:hypothetical protein